MEVGLDVDASAHNWHNLWADWAACCRQTWRCQEEKLFQVGSSSIGELVTGVSGDVAVQYA
jgi:hypothetical protein